MSLPHSQAYGREVLVRYLLGATGSEETELLDELSITDEPFAVQLSAVEDDLIDAYVRGELSGEELEQFRTFYLRSPKRRENVEFAESLLAHIDKMTAPGRSAARSAERPKGRPAWAAWAFAAAAALMLAMDGYLLYDNSQIRRQRAAFQERASALARQVESRESQAPQVNIPAAPLNASPKKEEQPPESVNILAFVLAPQMRGAGPTASVEVPRGSGSAVFRLELESDDYPEYEAALRDLSSNRVVWRNGRIKASTQDETKSIATNVPASVFQPRNYTFEVTGISAAGRRELVNTYVFHVLIP